MREMVTLINEEVNRNQNKFKSEISCWPNFVKVSLPLHKDKS